VQIIVYTGAILMLFLFVLMLVGVDTADSLVETIKGQRVLAVLAGLGFGSLLFFAVGNAIVSNPVGLDRVNNEFGGNTQGLAALIFNRYVFAFEATSALLITAAVGAMVLAHRERLVPKKGQAELVTQRMRRYAETGQHPGPLPTPGVFARHNAVDTPALLPDGSPSELSVSRVLIARGQNRNISTVADDVATIEAELGGPLGDQGPSVASSPDPRGGATGTPGATPKGEGR
jgi:NADH-quinone oxidoreductase subunit J